MGKIPFIPYQGEESSFDFDNREISAGTIYFTTDTGKIYLDTYKKERIPVGGSGAAIYYAKEAATENLETTYFEINRQGLENNKDKPKINDIILGTDKAFYKIINITEFLFICERLAIAGGSSEGGGLTRPTFRIEEVSSRNIINKTPVRISFIATSDKDEDGVPLASKLTVKWVLSSNGIDYSKDNAIEVTSGELSYVDILDIRDNATTKIHFTVEGDNHDRPSALSSTITIVASELTLEHSASFSNSVKYDPNNMAFTFNVKGNIPKIIDYYFDDSLYRTDALNANAPSSQECTFNSSLGSHGAHKITVELYQNLGDVNTPKKGNLASKLEFEIAVTVAGEMSPIIWFGQYKNKYYDYDSIKIPFLVYDPLNTVDPKVRLFKDGIEIESSPWTITSFEEFTEWEIVDADIDKYNYYSISCQNDSNIEEREIVFEVQQDEDPNKRMEIAKKDSLILNFDPKGRSNLESTTLRAQWKNSKGEYATFNNFNWYNNGWIIDEDKNTVLRISNGAEFIIPIDELIFASTQAGQQSNTIEMSFRLKNIQNYSKLITNITRYKKDNEYYNAFLNQTTYTNYDNYLQFILGSGYDELEFLKIQKNINLNNLVCSFYSGDTSNPVGICLGTQDAFFSNGINTVSVSYVEDEIINISFVYAHTLHLLLVYLNGVITGVIKSDISSENDFRISSKEIKFNSETCDIDLLKVRVYNTELNVSDIVSNFAVDKKDVGLFTQKKFAVENPALKEFQIQYQAVVDHNEKDDPDNYTMPYIIFDTDVLSYSKGNKRYISVEFVNPALERAYSKGQLEELAIADGLCQKNSTPEQKLEAIKTYYKHHCPSWTGYNVEFVVQGTSSEFYPRRNYKIKTKTDKDSDGQKRVHIFLNRGPFADEYKEEQAKLENGEISQGQETATRQNCWYMNNYTNGITKWTMKVDYMESSGSYNAGFAGLVGNAYTKHPLKDYLDQGAIIDTNGDLNSINKVLDWSDYRTSLLGFPVMAFQKKSDGQYIFLGYYRMLLDKGSDEVLGFKPNKNLKHNILQNRRVRDVAECWEFSNNARTYCSYRDPWQRVQLSFRPPEGTEDEYAFTSKNAPIISDHFEYRYSCHEDLLDLIYKYSQKAEDLKKEPYYIYNKEQAAEKLFEIYSNWEKVCQWIWSTNMDNVQSQNTYVKAPVGKKAYEPNKYYIMNESGEWVKSESETWVDGVIYAEQVYDENGNPTYPNAYVAPTMQYVYKKNKFYIENERGNKILCSENSFNESLIYYESQILQEDILKNTCDLLVTPCDLSLEFNPLTQYYTYDTENTVQNVLNGNLSIKPVTNPNQEDFQNGLYYIAQPVTYGGIEYKYDTKEYRNAKFIYDLDKHFDIEYLSVYFIMTEVFECYDSRGKNCMMASWGPLKENGEYIWYPIFYDIDTQLGINNTGIPSFEFNVDATMNNNYSTSDSILWNNFYDNFKNSYILNQYEILRGFQDGLDKPPLKSVENIEAWYTFQPGKEATDNIAAKGLRPLIATNLDMYFKYITITNPAAPSHGVGYLGKSETQIFDEQGTYFYALQGDRSQSRKQFLTNRIDYIDSWLTVGNYARAGENRIRGRISANNMDGSDISDIWVETQEDPYWANSSETIKTHKFDGEYWVNLTPIYSSYVTAGDDSANYPSQKYDGVTPKKFELAALKAGIKSSENYPEQLVYIYGMNKMSDVGDLSNLYWKEFYLEGQANKLTRLKLGHDGLDNGYQWYNNSLNGITLPAKLPLLKEMNLCNIVFSTEQSLNLSSSEKLENFRATGVSGLTNVTFADGVALSTLYLPSSINSLKLIEANNLTTIIKNYEYPEEVDGKLKAKPGLFLEGFFDEDFNTSLNSITIQGGNLKEASYDIFTRFIDKKASSTTSTLDLQKVNWTPYQKLVEGDSYKVDEADTYYQDSNHYTFIPYYYVSEDIFNKDILNGSVYKKSSNFKIDTSQAYSYLQDFANSSMKKKILTGSLLVNNIEGNSINELDVFNLIHEHFPRLQIYFEDDSKILKANVAKFVLYNSESGTYEQIIDINEKPLIQKVAIDNKFIKPSFEPVKQHYKFVGWSKIPLSTVEKEVEGYYNDSTQKFYKDETFSSEIDEANNPNTLYIAKNKENLMFIYEKINATQGNYIPLNDFNTISGIYDYYYYAVFKKDTYTITYHLGDGKTENVLVEYGSSLILPSNIPYKSDEDLDLETCYKFIGYSRTENGSVITLDGIKVTKNENFYAIFEEGSVYENVQTDYFKYTAVSSYSDGIYSVNGTCYQISPKNNLILKGKITIPLTHPEDGYPICFVAGFADQTEITHIFFERSGKNSQIREIKERAFTNLKQLKYFDFIDSIRTIEEYAFQGSSLSLVNTIQTTKGVLKQIGSNAFNQCRLGVDLQSSSGVTKVFKICSSALQSIGPNAFAYLSSDVAFEDIKINARSFSTEEGLGKGAFAQNMKTPFVDTNQNPIYVNIYVYKLNNDLQSKFGSMFSIGDTNSPTIHYEDRYFED